MMDRGPRSHSLAVTRLPLRFLLGALVLTACPAPEDDDPSADSTGGGGGGEVTPEVIAMRGACADADGAGTEHGGDITADETWAAADGPHRITTNLRVRATLTIEPCALVLIDPGVRVEIGGTTEAGRVVANGEATDDEVRPINIRAADGAWGEIGVMAGGELELSIAEIQGGGRDTDYGSALVVYGIAEGTNDGAPVVSTTLDRVYIHDAVGHGLELAGWGALTESSRDVWIRDCGGDVSPEAVRIEPGVASSLPVGLALEGNVRDEILLSTSKAFMRDDTLKDLGAPYRQRGQLYLAPGADGAPVTLTIEPGVTLAFEEGAGSGIEVGSSDARQGILVAEGTADAPILFTSALEAKAAGDWMGIIFVNVPISGNRISNATIEYAGGESGHDGFGCGPGDNDAAIIIHGQGPDGTAPDPIVTNTSFDHIGGETVIVSGWTSDSGPDLSASNTFGANTPGCHVSQPQRTGTGDVCDGGRDMCTG
jgi:hypothetical protein